MYATSSAVFANVYVAVATMGVASAWWALGCDSPPWTARVEAPISGLSSGIASDGVPQSVAANQMRALLHGAADGHPRREDPGRVAPRPAVRRGRAGRR